MRLRSSGVFRILDFDLEMRPLSYMAHDWVSAEITAFAWSWADAETVATLLLLRDGRYLDDSGVKHRAAKAFGIFREAYDQADMVTGHYIRKHDLPALNSALLEHGLPPLWAKLVSDTQQDLVRRKDMSASQANLAAMYDLAEQKHPMSQAAWRRSNRLTPDGIDEARKRVVDDVLQHKALRLRLLEARALKAPRVWAS